MHLLGAQRGRTNGHQGTRAGVAAHAMTGLTSLDQNPLRLRAAEAIAECRLIATMTEEPGRTTRRFLTAPVAEVHAHLRARMQALGMSATVDAAGNLRGLWHPAGASGKRLILGS